MNVSLRNAGVISFGFQMALFLLMGCQYLFPPPDAFKAIRIGMSEEKAKEVLGAPSQEYDAKTAPADYYVQGYEHPKRKITNSVLIYIRGEWILYVYIDTKGIVEFTFTGGS